MDLYTHRPQTYIYYMSVGLLHNAGSLSCDLPYNVMQGGVILIDYIMSCDRHVSPSSTTVECTTVGCALRLTWTMVCWLWGTESTTPRTTGWSRTGDCHAIVM